MKRRILFLILHTARLVGLFALARRFTRDDLRILCYHGAQIVDESRFRPGLFMSAGAFSARLDWLCRNGYPVLPLEDALQRLDAGTLPACASVITIDDGWYGTFLHQAPALHARDLPATIYIASYYLTKQTQVFGVALAYAVWKSGHETLPLSALPDALRASIDAPPGDPFDAVCAYAESLGSAAARQDLLRALASALDLDWQASEAVRQFAFMSAEEAKTLAAQGFDLQLHTHRHRYPDTTLEDARREIEDNRAVLEPIAGKTLTHFCYPSGRYSARNRDFLPQLGVNSATTTKSGFNRKPARAWSRKVTDFSGPCSKRLELTRFLDSERVSPIEFQAEMCGFFELIRRAGYPI